MKVFAVKKAITDMATEIFRQYPDKNGQRPVVAFKLLNQYWACVPLNNRPIYTRSGYYNKSLDKHHMYLRLPDYVDGKKHVASLTSLIVVDKKDLIPPPEIYNKKALPYLCAIEPVPEFLVCQTILGNIYEPPEKTIDWKQLFLNFYGADKVAVADEIRNAAGEKMTFLINNEASKMQIQRFISDPFSFFQFELSKFSHL